MTRANTAKIAIINRRYSCGCNRIERGRSRSLRCRTGG
jgi:hypothetical protein